MSETALPAGQRPRLLWPALLSILGVAILCTLGAWQIARMGEKHVFIERLSAQAAGAPAPMPASTGWADKARLPPISTRICSHRPRRKAPSASKSVPPTAEPPA